MLPRELGCVSGDRSLFISVLFHLVEARTLTHAAPARCGRQVSGEWIAFSTPHLE